VRRGKKHSLKSAFEAVASLLNQTNYTAADIERVYTRHFHKSAFPTPKVKSRPQFSRDIYPPFPSAYLGVGLKAKMVPNWRTATELLTLAAKDESILSRILAAYIWKRGELDRVRYVREGIVSTLEAALLYGSPASIEPTSGEDSPVVMWQCGRHVANPSRQPIIDQHTYRAFAILYGRYRPARYLSLRQTHLQKYLTWWETTVIKNLSASTDRERAMYLLDKLLFSIGKAALLYPNLYNRPRRKRKSVKI
jgi:hypothetical protein